MSETLVKWTGTLADETGWRRDLYEYLHGHPPGGVAIGRLPPSVQNEFQAAAKSGDEQRIATNLAAVLIACQQAYGGRVDGTVGADAITELYAAYTIDTSMTGTGPVDDTGAPLSVSFMPDRHAPFMIADVLELYVKQGFPQKIERPKDQGNNASVRFEEHTAILRDVDLVGSYAKSPNGDLVLVWSDQEETSGEGRRQSRWVVLAKERLLSEGRRPGRISGGAISDVGRFLVEVSASREGELSSELLGFEPAGNPFFSAAYNALPCVIAISSSGRLGAVHLASSMDKEDSNALILLDLVGKRELWRRHIAVYPRELAIREDAGLVDSVTASGPPCSFHLDGRTALDDASYADSLQAKADVQVLAAMAWARREDVGKVASDDPLFALLAAAVNRSQDPYFKARTLRDLGGVCQDSGLLDKTVEYWREALRISPKIGLKKRLAELELQLGVTLAKPPASEGSTEGRLRVLGRYEKLRADQVACLASAVMVATTSKGETSISEVRADGSLSPTAQVSGGTPRLYPLTTGLLVLTDEGRIGEGQGWASLITPSGEVLAQTHYEDKLTEAAISADLIALGCRDGHLYGLALADLKERWRFKVPGQGDGFSVAHPYHVAAGGDFVWVSYMSTCWAIDRRSGRQVLRKELDVPTELVALPDGTLATTIYKGLVLVTPKGSVKLTDVKEPNPRIYGLDAARGRIVAGRWGQGDDWYVFDFGGRIVQEAKLGPCDHAELSETGYLAIQLRDIVTVVSAELEKVGTLRQPEVTGNRVRAMAWSSESVLWVIGKGIWKLQVLA